MTHKVRRFESFSFLSIICTLMKLTLTRLRDIITETIADRGEWDDAFSTYSDMYKERYGIRPRWVTPEKTPLSDLLTMIEQLDDVPFDTLEYEPEESHDNEATPVVDELPELSDDVVDAPTRIPFRGGIEYDALSKNHNVIGWRPGQRRAAKTAYNRRLRRGGR